MRCTAQFALSDRLHLYCSFPFVTGIDLQGAQGRERHLGLRMATLEVPWLPTIYCNRAAIHWSRRP